MIVLNTTSLVYMCYEVMIMVLEREAGECPSRTFQEIFRIRGNHRRYRMIIGRTKVPFKWNPNSIYSVFTSRTLRATNPVFT